MTYYLALLVLFLLGFLVTELIKRIFFPRKINVRIKNLDGSVSVIAIIAGRDREIDQLLKEHADSKARGV